MPGILEQANRRACTRATRATLPPQLGRAPPERAAQAAGAIALALGRSHPERQMIADGERIVVIGPSRRAERCDLAKATGIDSWPRPCVVVCATLRAPAAPGLDPMARAGRQGAGRFPVRLPASAGAGPEMRSKGEVLGCIDRDRRPGSRSGRAAHRDDGRSCAGRTRAAWERGRQSSSTEGPGTRRPPGDPSGTINVDKRSRKMSLLARASVGDGRPLIVQR